MTAPKTIAIASTLVVPLLLVPSTSYAKSDRQDWRDFERGYNSRHVDTNVDIKRSRNKQFRQLFDKAAPPKISNHEKRFNQTVKKHYKGKNRRHGYQGDTYYDEWGMTCATPRQIHRLMKRQGWRRFHNLRIRPNVVKFSARQRNSDLTYNLKVDRCSGALIKAQLQRQDMWYLRWLRRLSWLN